MSDIEMPAQRGPRRTARRRGHGLLAVLVIAAAFAVMGQATALADSASVSVTDGSGNSDPVVDIGRKFTVAGATSAPTRVFVKVRATGGAACAPSAYTDSGTTYNFLPYGDNVNGAFSLDATGTWQAPGPMLFCIWIAGASDAAVTPISQVVTFRNPTGTVSGTLNPISPMVDQDATLTVTGASEAPKRVFAKIRAAGGAPCAASAYGDSGSYLIDGTAVNGAFTLTATTASPDAGPKQICLWVADASDDTAPTAGPQPVTFTVLAPPPPCIVPAIAGGSSMATATAALTGAGCRLGILKYQASTKYARGTVLRTITKPGTTKPTATAVGLLISAGRPCVVPGAPRGLSLSAARTRLSRAGCTAGSVLRVHGSRRRGTLVRYGRSSGTHLAPGARVAVVLSSGRRHR